ncbi:NADPH-dependent FMN reductase [Deinococcus sp.]|uniref:NADPH-dependent FMN reductase n=1 Tax=Deinococcus sp. TaxID=47478 RepID=UPI003B5A851A
MPVRLLALSGSLRRESVNAALLHAAAQLFPPEVVVDFYSSHGNLPHFSPDIEAEAWPAVEQLRTVVSAADGLLIACPEYAHGLPGSFKNALDWLVGGGELTDKPISVLNASARSIHGPPALLKILRTMGGVPVPPKAVVVNIPRLSTAADILASPGTCAALSQAVESLVLAIQKNKTAEPVEASGY